MNYFHNLISNQIPISKFYVLNLVRSMLWQPKPGLTNDAIREFNIEPKASYYIGDRWRDIDLANNIGCFSIFIDYNYDEKLKTK